MKKLLNIILLVLLVGCKQIPKTDIEVKQVGEAKPNVTFQEEKEQTIEEFLQQLRVAVKNGNMVAIKKSIKFPFEFKIGGEPFIYNNISDLIKDCPDFYDIQNAKFEKIEDNIYNILYEDPEVSEDPPEGGRFFIYYYAKKEGDSFKLFGMEKPH